MNYAGLRVAGFRLEGDGDLFGEGNQAIKLGNDYEYSHNDMFASSAQMGFLLVFLGGSMHFAHFVDAFEREPRDALANLFQNRRADFVAGFLLSPGLPDSGEGTEGHSRLIIFCCAGRPDNPATDLEAMGWSAADASERWLA